MECRHGLSPWFCPSCADDRPTWVFRTTGGSTYHARTDCEQLVAGWSQAYRRGLVEHPVERITRAEAEAYLYQPCATCTQPNSAGHIDRQTGALVWARGA